MAFDLESATVLRRGRATVLRARRTDGAGLPSDETVIVKRFEPAHRDHFLRERAGLRVLGGGSGIQAIAPDLDGFVPRLLGDDEDTLTLVMSDVAARGTLADVLSADDGEAATAWLSATAERLGFLHGWARALVPAFAAFAPESPSPGEQLRDGIAATLSFVRRALADEASISSATLDAIEGDVRDALLDVAERVDQIGPLSTITLGDMAPSNVLLGRDDVGRDRPIFIDLEYCAVRHAFYDAMFWRCICPFPGAVADAMDARYRGGLRAAGVQIEDAPFRREMLLFTSHRLFWTLGWSRGALFEEDRDFVPGVGARAMLRRYLRDYVAMAAGMPAAGAGAVGTNVAASTLLDVAERLGERLARLWPDTGTGFEFSCFGRV